MGWKDVPIPNRMKDLERDRRGYPIPATVFRDLDGRAHFTVNDHHRTTQAMIDDRCPICGQKNDPGLWFVGGPLSAFHPNGAYYDLPGHEECTRYALRVCPYLAMPSYSRRIEDRTINRAHVHEQQVFFDPTVMSERPGVFARVMVMDYDLITYPNMPAPHLKPKPPYLRFEFWKEGVQTDQGEGLEVARKLVAAYGAMINDYMEL